MVQYHRRARRFLVPFTRIFASMACALWNHRRFANSITGPTACPEHDPDTGPNVASPLRFPGKAVHEHGISLAVDDVFHLTDESGQPRLGETAFEDRELHSLPILLAHVRDSPEARGSRGFRIGDVVGDQYVHASRVMEEQMGDIQRCLLAGGARAALPGPRVSPIDQPDALGSDAGFQFPCGPPTP